jgi:hypothetical protein
LWRFFFLFSATFATFWVKKLAFLIKTTLLWSFYCQISCKLSHNSQLPASINCGFLCLLLIF